MFEPSTDPVALEIARFSRWLEESTEPGDSAALVDRIRSEENLRSVVAAKQARDTTEFASKRTAEQVMPELMKDVSNLLPKCGG